MQLPKIFFAALLLFSVVEAAASGADADAKRRPPVHCGLGRKVLQVICAVVPSFVANMLDASPGDFALLKTQIEDEYVLEM
ncbi:hypothetical protein C8J56DRAFT_1045102 [Mycena floridula]|nr:hypothetical protein C8J56DRAFT_1045102 [Mycena floridula]